jgi:hypothetical protein
MQSLSDDIPKMPVSVIFHNCPKRRTLQSICIFNMVIQQLPLSSVHARHLPGGSSR